MLTAAVVVGAGLALGVASILFGEINQDEGWYLYAARLVAAGKMPYLDFHFTQTPLLPYVYGGLIGLWRDHGVLGGRVLTGLLGAGGIFLAAALAGRLAPSGLRAPAALTAAAVLAINVYHVYFTTVVKTYSLTGFLLVGGYLALAIATGPRLLLGCALSGALLAAASGSRISAGVTLPVTGLCLLFLHRRAEWRWGWLAFGIGGGLILAALYGPYLVAGREAFLFAMSMHSGRQVGGLMNTLVYKAGFLSRLTSGYLALAGLAFAAAGLAAVRRGRGVRAGPAEAMAWIGALAVSLLHFTAPFPYDDYQVPVMPLFAAGIAVWFWRGVDHVAGDLRRATRVALAVVCLGAGVVAGASPLVQGWFVAGRDRIWWRTKQSSDLRQLETTAAKIREVAGSRLPAILTQDTYLALETGASVPIEMAMGPFCYYPKVSTEKARRMKVLNKELMLELIRASDAPVAAVSGYGFAIAMPAVEPVPEEDQAEFLSALIRRYQLMGEIPGFGQGQTTLRLYQRRAP